MLVETYSCILRCNNFFFLFFWVSIEFWSFNIYIKWPHIYIYIYILLNVNFENLIVGLLVLYVLNTYVKFRSNKLLFII